MTCSNNTSKVNNFMGNLTTSDNFHKLCYKSKCWFESLIKKNTDNLVNKILPLKEAHIMDYIE